MPNASPRSKEHRPLSGKSPTHRPSGLTSGAARCRSKATDAVLSPLPPNGRIPLPFPVALGESARNGGAPRRDYKRHVAAHMSGGRAILSGRMFAFAPAGDGAAPCVVAPWLSTERLAGAGEADGSRKAVVLESQVPAGASLPRTRTDDLAHQSAPRTWGLAGSCGSVVGFMRRDLGPGLMRRRSACVGSGAFPFVRGMSLDSGASAVYTDLCVRWGRAAVVMGAKLAYELPSVPQPPPTAARPAPPNRLQEA